MKKSKNEVFKDFMRIIMNPSISTSVVNKARTDLRAALKGDQKSEEGAIAEWVRFFKKMFRTDITLTGTCSRPEHGLRVNVIKIDTQVAREDEPDPVKAMKTQLEQIVNSAACKHPLPQNEWPKADSPGLCQNQLRDLVQFYSYLPPIIHLAGVHENQFSMAVPKTSENLEIVVKYTGDDKEETASYKLSALFKHSSHHWTVYVRSGNFWWLYNDVLKTTLKPMKIGDVMEGDSAMFVKNTDN